MRTSATEQMSIVRWRGRGRVGACRHLGQQRRYRRRRAGRACHPARGAAARRGRGRLSRTTPLDALVRLPDVEWRTMLAVHLDGTFFGTRAAARSMAQRGGGVIVNVASVCGIEGCAGYPHYSAAKGGILAFTRSVAKELIVQGIRVNAIAPGFIETPTAGMQGAAVRRGATAADSARPLRPQRGDRRHGRVPRERRRRVLRRRDAQPERRHRHNLGKKAHRGRT